MGPWNCLDRSRGARCWCSHRLFLDVTMGKGGGSQKDCDHHTQRCSRHTKLRAPETLHEIYYSLAQDRASKSKWLGEFNYLYMLRDAGCFDERTAPEPERFAELMASTEDKIRLRASGGLNSIEGDSSTD